MLIIRDRIGKDDCIGTAFIQLSAISGQGDDGTSSLFVCDIVVPSSFSSSLSFPLFIRRSLYTKADSFVKSKKIPQRSTLNLTDIYYSILSKFILGKNLM